MHCGDERLLGTHEVEVRQVDGIHVIHQGFEERSADRSYRGIEELIRVAEEPVTDLIPLQGDIIGNSECSGVAEQAVFMFRVPAKFLHYMCGVDRDATALAFEHGSDVECDAHDEGKKPR